MAVGSVVVAAGAVSRHTSCRLLMRPPVICFVWTALGSVVAHSIGKKDDTSRRAEGVSRRIGVRGGSLAAMFAGEMVCLPFCEKDMFLMFLQDIILPYRFCKSHVESL